MRRHDRCVDRSMRRHDTYSPSRFAGLFLHQLRVFVFDDRPERGDGPVARLLIELFLC
jgi:hypothetical protein